MKWYRIPLPRIPQPDTGTYRSWKPQLRVEGRHQCVYCAIHEAKWGGERNFHVEHYRPKSNIQFAALENDVTNLYYACSVCNGFKSNDWPGEPDATLAKVSYPNPSEWDFNELIQTDERGQVEAERPAMKYTVERLYLNRPQLIMERREARLRLRQEEARRLVSETLADQSAEKRRVIAEILLGFLELEAERQTMAPYEPNQIRR